MKILGIDTATPYLTLGIIDDQRILSELRFNADQTHAQILLPNIDRVLNEADIKLEELDGIAISIGPGSFTGLRIGLATAKGLCFASGIPLISVPTLDGQVYYQKPSSYPLVPILDAKKNEVYSAVYDSKDGKMKRVSDYWVTSIEKLVAKIPDEVIFLGLGLEVYKENLSKLLREKAHFLEGEGNLPSGTAIAFLGHERFKRSESEDIDKMEPLYLRSSEQELKFKNV